MDKLILNPFPPPDVNALLNEVDQKSWQDGSYQVHLDKCTASRSSRIYTAMRCAKCSLTAEDSINGVFLCRDHGLEEVGEVDEYYLDFDESCFPRLRDVLR